MAVSYRTQATANSGATQVASQAVTIPGTVAAGDGLLLLVLSESNSSTQRVHAVTSTGTAWTAAATQPARCGVTANYFLSSSLWFCPAGASDAGKVVTATISSGGNEYMAVQLLAYPGAAVTEAAAIDVIGSASYATLATSFATPSVTTVAGGDWDVELIAGNFGTSGSGTVSAPAGLTLRGSASGPDGQFVGGADGGTALGASTGIGGGNFAYTTSAAAICWTVGLASATTAWVIAGTATSSPATAAALAWTAVLAGSAVSASTTTGNLAWVALISGTATASPVTAGDIYRAGGTSSARLTSAQAVATGSAASTLAVPAQAGVQVGDLIVIWCAAGN